MWSHPKRAKVSIADRQTMGPWNLTHLLIRTVIVMLNTHWSGLTHHRLWARIYPPASALLLWLHSSHLSDTLYNCVLPWDKSTAIEHWITKFGILYIMIMRYPRTGLTMSPKRSRFTQVHVARNCPVAWLFLFNVIALYRHSLDGATKCCWTGAMYLLTYLLNNRDNQDWLQRLFCCYSSLWLTVHL